MYQNYTRKTEREERRRREEREAIKGLLFVLALFLLCLAFVAATLRAIMISAASYETLVVVERSVEVEPVPEVEEVVWAEEFCPLIVSEFYDVPLDMELQAHIINECGGYEIDPAVVFAMIERESGFRADAVGDNGKSFGLMQIMRKWHEDRMEKLGVTDLLDPFQNVSVGIDFLAWQLDRYEGDMAKALVGYNAGSFKGAVTDYAKGVLARSEELKAVTINVLTDDPVRDAERHMAEQDERLERYPKCARCGYEIQDERLFDFNGELYHIDCAEEEFKKYTEDYIE